MNPAQLERLCEHLLKLRLFKSRERLEALLQHAADKELAYSDFLEQVLSEEVAAKTSKNVIMLSANAPQQVAARETRLSPNSRAACVCPAGTRQRSFHCSDRSRRAARHCPSD